MKIAVTGGSGFLGKWVVRALKEAGHEVASIDIAAGIDDRWTTFSIDLTVYLETKNTLKVIKPDAIIHLAALAGATGKGGGAESLKDPYRYFKANQDITLNVFEACRELGIRRVIYMSSFSPFGNAQCPITEETPLDPDNPYGGSKANCETIAKIYAKKFGIKTIIFRVPLMCGEGQKEKNALREFVFAAFDGQPLIVWSDGSTLREFVHPSDVANAYLLGLKHMDGMQAPYETFVLGNKPITMANLAKLVKNTVGKGEIQFLRDKPTLFDQFTRRDKVETILGWFPKITVQEIVERVVRESK